MKHNNRQPLLCERPWENRHLLPHDSEHWQGWDGMGWGGGGVRGTMHAEWPTTPPANEQSFPSNSPDRAVSPGTHRREVLVPLRHLPDRLVQLLPIELGPLLGHLDPKPAPPSAAGRGRLRQGIGGSSPCREGGFLPGGRSCGGGRCSSPLASAGSDYRLARPPQASVPVKRGKEGKAGFWRLGHPRCHLRDGTTGATRGLCGGQSLYRRRGGRADKEWRRLATVWLLPTSS